MMRSHVEELYAEYLIHKGYFVMQDIPFYNSKNKPGGWSDIDVLAYKGKELIVAECKTDIVGGIAGDCKKKAEKLKEHFKKANKFVERKYPFLSIKDVKLKVVYERGTINDKPSRSPKFDEECKNRGIEAIHISTVIGKLIHLLKKHSREWHPTTRVLLTLKQLGYFKNENLNNEGGS